MANAGWITFWILSGLCALAGIQPIFFTQFITFLIVMRVRNNDMPPSCWYGLWFSFINSGGMWMTAIETDAGHATMTILLIVRLCLTSDYQMPTPTFWVLYVWMSILAGLSSQRDAEKKYSPAAVAQFALFIFNCYIDSQGIHLPGIRISHYVTAAVVLAIIIVANAAAYDGKYLPALFMWFVSIGVFRQYMWPWSEEFGWLCIIAWFIHLQTMQCCFAPSMPYVFYPCMLGILVGLGFAIRPDVSLGRFTLWTSTVWVLRFILYGGYVFYYLGFNISWQFFPFSYFSHSWRVSKPRWFPLSSRNADSFNHESLCTRCAFVDSSRLIMGSRRRFVRMVEWHAFYTREEFIAKFDPTTSADTEAATTTTATPKSDCRLCLLLWHSMTPRRRGALASSVQRPGVEQQPQLSSSDLPEPNDRTAELRVKVWEERPLSPFTYMQLHWGSTAVGARLLVHRGELFSTPSEAIKQAKTNSPEHFEQAKEWIKKCRDNHQVCRGPGNALPNPPARMLQVLGGDDWQPGKAPTVLKLINTSDMDPSSPGDYLAFSHCWGPPSEMRFKLVAANLVSCYSHIDFHSLSQNMQDAITVTLTLGYSHIWIDSLCIIQHDPSNPSDESWTTDWNTEAPKMGSVYSNAACTIASTASATSTGGCFHSRETSTLLPVRIGVSSPDALLPSLIYVRRDDTVAFTRGVDLAPLNTRGWVMQERLLSRRVLHFGEDLLFWECCGRAASELNPQGYTYKRPRDFKDNYSPDLSGYINNRGTMREAELQGRGISWAGDESINRRPPPVMVDPDAPRGSDEVWQRKRGFWRNVLKEDSAGWDADEKETERDRAGFRGAFERLRGGGGAGGGGGASMSGVEDASGRDAFSQVWYDLVESYSRTKLTMAKDKLMAFKGIEDEVARATKFTYLKGVWRESLVTDLLWFAIEGPGARLVDLEGVPVAPTWSWASIEGVVALDLLPETSLQEVEDKRTLARIEHVSPVHDDPAQMKLSLSAPVLEAVKLVRDDVASTWQVRVGEAEKPAARAFLDVELVGGLDRTDLVCASFLVLNRSKTWARIKSSSEDVQGLVLRKVAGEGQDGNSENTYERVGYFTTSYIAKSKEAKAGRKALKEAKDQRICLIGWADPR
ncbi:hypothetical protein OQA88_10939 [Cercophora sp. LCS_1]